MEFYSVSFSISTLILKLNLCNAQKTKFELHFLEIKLIKTSPLHESKVHCEVEVQVLSC